MKNKNEQNNENKKVGFFDKVKNAMAKFFKGVKNFFVKTGRVNSSNCYGIINGIGDLIIYEDHALISAVGMDDITFNKENVLSYSFNGLGKIRRKRATVEYNINLDDNVVFPEKVREKNNVKNLTAIIFLSKERQHFLCSGKILYGTIVPCDIYKYDGCFVIAVKLERRVGDKTEKYEESVLYPFSDIELIQEKKNGEFTITFKDKKSIYFTAPNSSVYETIKKLM